MAIPTTKITFKKLAAGASILGLVAVPSFVHAQGQTSTSTGSTTNTTGAVNSSAGRATAAAHTQSTVSTNKTDDTSSADVDTSTSVDSSKSANTGSVTTNTGQTVPTTTNTATKASVSFENAVSTAQDLFGSKAVVRAMLLDSKASSTPVYLVTFSDGSKVVVDGTSGNIIFSYDAITKATTGTWPFPLQKHDDGDHVSLPAVQQKLAAVSESYNADISHSDH